MAKYNGFRGNEDDVQKSQKNQSQFYHREQSSEHSLKTKFKKSAIMKHPNEPCMDIAYTTEMLTDANQCRQIPTIPPTNADRQFSFQTQLHK